MRHDVYKVLSKYIEPVYINDIELAYGEKHRHYHTMEHINSMYNYMIAKDYASDLLVLAIVFHDIIYDPKSKTNEEQSALKAETFLSKCGMKNHHIEEISIAIKATKDHLPTTVLGRMLCELDLIGLSNNLDSLILTEKAIFKEFQFADWKEYQKGRIEFLNIIKGSSFVSRNNDIDCLIDYVKTKQPNIGVYAGSFNPFHKGHLNILHKAEKVFDKVIIAQGINPDKKHLRQAVLPSGIVFANPDGTNPVKQELYYHQTESYDGLLTDFIESLGYKVTLIRGLRNITDLQAELNQYRFIKELMPELETVSFYCDAEFEHISSSTIRQLKEYKTNLSTKYTV